MAIFGRRFPLPHHQQSALLFAAGAGTPTGTILYPRLEIFATSGIAVKPSGFLASWDQTDTSRAGTSARDLNINFGSSQTSATKIWPGILNGANNKLGAAQFLSKTLAAQTMSGGNWGISFAADVTNAVPGKTWEGWGALYLVNGSTGATRTTIFDLTLLPSTVTGRTSAAETTVYSSAVSGGGWTSLTGDYLSLELGLKCSNS